MSTRSAPLMLTSVIGVCMIALAFITYFGLRVDLGSAEFRVGIEAVWVIALVAMCLTLDDRSEPPALFAFTCWLIPTSVFIWMLIFLPNYEFMRVINLHPYFREYFKEFLAGFTAYAGVYLVMNGD
jgi:hypothetical protein